MALGCVIKTDTAAKAAKKGLGSNGRCLVSDYASGVACAWLCKQVSTVYVQFRQLLKVMLKNIPVDDIKKSSMFCPGGDIRIKGNRWLRDSLEEACMSRILREGKVGLLLGYLAHTKQLCPQLSFCRSLTYMGRLAWVSQFSGPAAESHERWIRDEVSWQE